MVNTPTPPKKFLFPLSLLVLDMIGLAIVGLGVAEQLGRIEIIPPSWRFTGSGLMLMLFGLVCMLPLLGYVFSIVKRAKAEENVWIDSLPDYVKKKLEEKIKREPTK